MAQAEVKVQPEQKYPEIEKATVGLVELGLAAHIFPASPVLGTIVGLVGLRTLWK